jgi:hypothetical protein
MPRRELPRFIGVQLNAARAKRVTIHDNFLHDAAPRPSTTLEAVNGGVCGL